MPAKARQPADQPQGAAASLLNGLAVLEAFTIASPSLGVTEIANRVGLHKSTVSRILSGLAEAGYVQREEETGRYRLGLGVISLSGPLLANLDVRRAALPYLEELTEQTSETAAISVWNGAEAVVVEQVASPHQVKHTASIGTRYPRFESSSVRVFLAELPLEQAVALVESGRVSRGNCARLEGSIELQLKRVREAGFAVNDGCTTEEEYGVSAPVRDYRGAAVGCITVSAPRSRVHRDGSADRIAEAVLTAARQLSARLGAPATSA